MTERDNDIEFDFFDEPETEEATERRRLPRRSRPSGPGGPRRPVRPPAGLIPMLRLAGLIAFLILAAVLFVVLVRGCASSTKHDTYASYLQKVSGIASRSAQIGRELNTKLTATGVKEASLESAISGLAAQEQQEAAQARGIGPPGPLRVEHDHLIEALDLRASALSRLADAFRRTTTAKDATAAGRQLSAQAQLLVASDVNWDFYFMEATVRELQNQGVHNVVVPDSNILPTPDIASTQSLTDVWRRIHGAATGGTPSGSHGSALVSVKALPDGTQLSTSSEATITASTDLAFEVAVMDSGQSEEFGVRVTLTIQKNPAPIVQHQTIATINAGETKMLTFKNLGKLPFGVPTTVKVDVQPVPGEKTIGNNSAEYKVIFSFG